MKRLNYAQKRYSDHPGRRPPRGVSIATVSYVLNASAPISEATRQLMAARPDLKVIMLTVSGQDEDLFEAIKAGAQGYLLKTVTSGRELLEAVAGVAAGEAIITPALAPRLLAEFATLALGAEEQRGRGARGQGSEGMRERGEVEVLTLREREVLELVAEGLTNKEIAARLVVSENTVRAHMCRILDKLHVRSRVEAAIWL